MFNCLIRRIQYLEKEIPKLEKNIKRAPSGKLRIYASGRYSRWMVLLPDGGKKYLPKSESARALKLWHKQIDMDVLDIYKRELMILKRANDALVKLYSTREKHINVHVNSALAKDRAVFVPEPDWSDQPYKKNPYKPENLIVDGPKEKMRSKSEVIIARALANHKIEYRYECEYILNGQIVFPDFMIKRPVDGKIIIWEHFGLWDDESYREKALAKIIGYIKSGLTPFDDFIYSVETKDNPTNANLIDNMIEMLLL